MSTSIPIDVAERVPGLLGDLRSDHAGETGAVFIYRGILAVSRDADVRDFATRHLATEQRHLDLIEEILPPSRRSLLLPIWRIAGFLTGWLPALAGRRAVFATIEAVETFVDHHYAEQIAKLAPTGEEGALRRLLEECQGEEIHHRDEAAAALGGVPPGVLLRGWAWLVGFGSASAVAAARRI
jgi:ubiquinone biosynthesis monooxygenase Coq7